MDSTVLHQLFDSRRDLLSLPQTLAEVLRVVRDETSSGQQLGAVLARDPAMTARVLRMVNSAYYGGNRQVGDITQAVMLIGVRQVTALTLSASVYQLASGWDTNIEQARFWRHSLEVAIASRKIAEQAKLKSPDEMFVAGLLHDIGMLILDQSYPDTYGQVLGRTSETESLCDCEDEIWGTDHARVGQFLLEQWQLPERICQAVGRHHVTYTSGMSESDLAGCQVVALANLISRFRVTDRPVSAIESCTAQKGILRENLGLSPSDLAAIEQRLFDETVEEARFLDIEIGSANELLVEANRRLLEQYAAVESLLRDNREMRQEVARAAMQTMSGDNLRVIVESFSFHLNDISDRLREVEVGRSSDASAATKRSLCLVGAAESLKLLAEELQGLTGANSAIVDTGRYLRALDEKIRQRLESSPLESVV